MLAGLTFKLARESGLRVTVTPIEEVRKEAVIFAVVFAVTDFVVTLKVADVAPLATVTVAGTLAALEPLDNLIAKPPVGAADEIATVPAKVAPPKALKGVTVRALTDGALMVKLAEDELLPEVALMAATVFAETGRVAMLNVADVLPDGTVTEDPTEADVFDEDKLTMSPSEPAALLSVTVPTDDAPPATLVGDRVTFVTDCAVTDPARQAKIAVVRNWRAKGFKPALRKP